MPMLVSFAKVIGAPGSIGFLAFCVGLGLLMSRAGKRGRRVGRVWILLVCVLYAILSLPIVANGIAAPLTNYRPIEELRQLGRVDILVVLAGDNLVGRVREAKRMFDALQPSRIIVSGQSWLVENIVAAGIPFDHVNQESDARTTREQLVMVSQLVRSGRVMIIASRVQMPRVAALVEQMQLPVILAPSSIDIEPPASGVRLIIPAYIALRVSRDALYEHAALAYYRRRGWIGTTLIHVLEMGAPAPLRRRRALVPPQPSGRESAGFRTFVLQSDADMWLLPP